MDNRRAMVKGCQCDEIALQMFKIDPMAFMILGAGFSTGQKF